MKQGLLAAAAAYLIWGVFPIYWKLLSEVPSLQIIAHRIVWCAVFVFALLHWREGIAWWSNLSRRLLGLLALSSALIGANWWLYIWGVNSGHIVETSLGYFINPLVSVLLGILVFRERLNARQWLAVAIAAAGVLYLTIQAGRPPWIAFGLALSFGGYGLVRKIAPVAPVQGLAVETGFLVLPALAYLLFVAQTGEGSFGHAPLQAHVLLLVSGPITALPLALFAFGARRIPLSTIGILQYLAPTLQLLCGVFLYHEPFTASQAIGFGCIWTALAIYAADGLYRTRKLRAPTTPASS